jgi:tRNA A-37 threonylcarbamoyl transferase component Bud32
MREYVERAPSDRRVALLGELIKLDLEYRWKKGEHPEFSEYLQEFATEVAGAGERWHADLSAYASDLAVVKGVRTAEPASPVSIGRYRVIRELDRGGQAIVYHGIHPQLGREVVIKWSKEALPPDKSERDRILAEGRILAELDHPNIAQVYDFDFCEDRAFLVIEYIRGRNLEQYADQDKPDGRTIATLAAKTARALAAAHRRGIIHQDLKPKNILVDENGQPWVIDFGLARLRHGWHEDMSPSFGTVAYISPEQARQEIHRIQPHTDVFGLGAVLYRLLVGKAPYSANSFEEALRKARECEFDRDRLENRGVPAQLKAICLRAMACEPNERYATADAMAEKLERAARPPQRWPWVVAVAAMLALALPAVAWMLGWFSKPPKPLTVEIYRDMRYRPLSRIIPLRPGDEFRIEAEAPAKMHVGLYWVDARGKVERLASVSPGPAAAIIEHPPREQGSREKMALALDGKPGTVFVFACGKASGPVRDEEVQQLFPPDQPLPELPRDSVVRVKMDTVRAEGESEETSKGDPRVRIDYEGRAMERLDSIRKQLLERGFDFVDGVAFRHPEKSVND